MVSPLPFGCLVTSLVAGDTALAIGASGSVARDSVLITCASSPMFGDSAL